MQQDLKLAFCKILDPMPPTPLSFISLTNIARSPYFLTFWILLINSLLY